MMSYDRVYYFVCPFFDIVGVKGLSNFVNKNKNKYVTTGFMGHNRKDKSPSRYLIHQMFSAKHYSPAEVP